MRCLICASLLAIFASDTRTEAQANFVHIAVTAAVPTSMHAIWRPYAGAISATGAEQQARLAWRRIFEANPDSVRHWQDETAKDTIRVTTPTEFVVDMTAGPVVIEALGSDSIRVEAQLTPRRGPLAGSW